MKKFMLCLICTTATINAQDLHEYILEEIKFCEQELEMMKSEDFSSHMNYYYYLKGKVDAYYDCLDPMIYQEVK